MGKKVRKTQKWLTMSMAAAVAALSIQTSVFAETPAERVGESKPSVDQVMGMFSLQAAAAGLQVQSHQTPEQLLETLLGKGVTISNVKFNGNGISAGTFTGGEQIIGFDSGIILSSGSVHNVVGPNISDGITTINYLPGDENLNTLIPGYATRDATVLEFDFIPSEDVISFQYVFASDEYNEYVNSQFNDVFGFFLNGVNVALLDDGSPVAINNINGSRNPHLYRNNDPSDGTPQINTEMDGITRVLSVNAKVNPGQVNHIKLAIADAGDSSLDSNIFLSANTFSAEPIGVLELGQTTFSAKEGGTAEFQVVRKEGTNGQITVDYSFVDGTAVAGKDYVAEPGTLTFATSETVKTISVPILSDTLVEGTESFQVVLSNPTGGAALGAVTSAQVDIQDGVDTTSPVTKLLANGAQPTHGYYNNDIMVELSASDDHDGTLQTYYKVNGGALKEYTGPFTLNGAASFKLEYYSQDQAGNVEKSQTANLYIDKKAPVTTYKLNPVWGTKNGISYIKGYTVTLKATDNMSGVKEILYRINGGAWKVYNGAFEVQGQQVLNIEFYSVDHAGNKEVIPQS